MPMVHQAPAVRTTLRIGHNRRTAEPFEVPVYVVYKEDQENHPMSEAWFRFDIDEQAAALHLSQLSSVDERDVTDATNGHVIALESALGRAWDNKDPALIAHFEEGLSFSDSSIIDHVLPAARSTGLPVHDPDDEPGPRA